MMRALFAAFAAMCLAGPVAAQSQNQAPAANFQTSDADVVALGLAELGADAVAFDDGAIELDWEDDQASSD